MSSRKVFAFWSAVFLEAAGLCPVHYGLKLRNSFEMLSCCRCLDMRCCIILWVECEVGIFLGSVPGQQAPETSQYARDVVDLSGSHYFTYILHAEHWKILDTTLVHSCRCQPLKISVLNAKVGDAKQFFGCPNCGQGTGTGLSHLQCVGTPLAGVSAPAKSDEGFVRLAHLGRYVRYDCGMCFHFLF